MGALRDYLRGLARIHTTGEAVEETSYYGQLEKLLNVVGRRVTPSVTCVLTTRNRGAGIPDGGLFLHGPALEEAGRDVIAARAPERGVMEVKGLARDVRRIARSQQVRKYLDRYGKVLITTYREFLIVTLGDDGELVAGEVFTLASDEVSFWKLARTANPSLALEAGFEDYLKRVLLGDAPLSQPADLAWFLAAYAREGRKRLEEASDGKKRKALATLRAALENGLGLRFEGEKGENFFRSALVQTLFYGVFASWVVWSEARPPESKERFRWRHAQWTLNVPMVRVLFQQLTTPAYLPAGLDKVLDWAEDTLARVDRKLFFDRFESASAVQYFYEPFLDAYDPELRRQLGVWYTPPEVVRYMVARVHHALQNDLGLELGLADENVHVLDPCTGTGSFLVETVETIARVLEERHGDNLVAQDAKEAALKRVYGFELLPAPFVIAHLNVGLALERLGAPLTEGERARVYLTNALTGWVEDSEEHPALPFPEFEEERDAATSVKRTEPILVVLGNPPYNGFAGVSGREEGGLVAPYKDGLREKWDITKNKLDDLYIRFFRVAERRITEQTGKGIVCFISNFSWLGDPSTVVMRQRLVAAFDRIYVDNLNGDSRETGKKTPDGQSDPSVFSTRLHPAGIQVGTAITLLVRQDSPDNRRFEGWYRDFWGVEKGKALEASLHDSAKAPHATPLNPDDDNWYRLRRWSPRHGYENWPAVPELATEEPMLGLIENRSEALTSHSREPLLERMKHYLDPNIDFSDLDVRVNALKQNWARFDPEKTRAKLLKLSPFDEHKVIRFCVKPFDVRWAYVDTTRPLWNEPRPELVKAAMLGSDFLLLRRRAPRALDGAALLHSRCLIDQHVMHKDAYVIPFLLANEGGASTEAHPSGTVSLFDIGHEASRTGTWRPNLSELALNYLAGLGINDADTSRASARLIWLHVLAIGYSPLYLEENGDAIRSDWPRVPLPPTREDLLVSARLGQQIAELLDIDNPTATAPQGGGTAKRRTIAQVERIDGKHLAPQDGDLSISAGWGTIQTRRQKSGAISRIVMPGNGRISVRERSDTEWLAIEERDIELLGADVLDVFLNDRVCWRGVPEAVWDFKIGGFQVLRKWLSYRDRNVVGRDLTVAEVRQFTSICHRLTDLILLGPALDANYKATIGIDAHSTD